MGGTISVNVPLFEGNILTIGVDWRQDVFITERDWVTLTRRQETGGRILNLSGYFQDEMYFFNNKLITTLGLRYDWAKGYTGRVSDTNPPEPSLPVSTKYPSRTEDEISPKFGLTYHLTDETSFRASAGKAFRFPVITQLYHITMHPTFTYVGNPDLKPETLISYEVGVDHWFLPKKLFGRCTAYQSRGKDFIGMVVTTLGPPMGLTVDNITKVKIWGIETELQYINKYWALSVDYTYNRSKIEEYEGNPALEGEDLAYSSRHKFGVFLSYSNPAILNVGIGMRYFSKSYATNRKELEGYYTYDIKLSKKLNKFTELTVGVENLFDKKYHVEHEGGDTYLIAPGRLVTVGVTMQI